MSILYGTVLAFVLYASLWLLSFRLRRSSRTHINFIVLGRVLRIFMETSFGYWQFRVLVFNFYFEFTARLGKHYIGNYWLDEAKR